MVNNIQGGGNPANQQSANVQGVKQSQAAATNTGVELSHRKSDAFGDGRGAKNIDGVADTAEIHSAVNELNTRLESQEIQVNFDVDDETGRIVVMVTDSKSGETIRQIPSEATLEFAHNAKKGVGITLDGTF